MKQQSAVGTALLEWVNSSSLTRRVDFLADLNDGHKIWEVLQDVDSEYIVGRLPEPLSASGKWLARWQNLKLVNKSLTTYVTKECQQDLPRDLADVDLKSIAIDGNELLKLVLVAAINSPKAMEYIGKMPTLSMETQTSLKDIIEEVASQQQTSDTETSNGRDVSSSPSTALDPELAFEERFGKVMADNERLVREKNDIMKEMTDLDKRLVRLQENNDALQERLTEAEDGLKQNKSTQGSHGGMKQLESRLQHQEDLIANQESKLSETQSKVESLQISNDKLRASHERSQRLRDELDEVKTERDSLAKKANTIDKYKQKLQASQTLEKENDLVRGELDEIRQQLKDADQARQKVAGLNLAIDEYKRILPKIEQDRHELQMMKKQLEFDNSTLAQRWEKAIEQHARDQESLAEMGEKLRFAELPKTPGVNAVGGLETELQQSLDHEDKDMNDLISANQQLRNDYQDMHSKKTATDQLLDDSKRKNADLDKKYFETYQNMLLLEHSLAAIGEGNPMESSKVYTRMRDQLQAERTERQGRERDLVKSKRQLREAQNDLSAVGKPERDALELLKESNEGSLHDLMVENTALQQRLQSSDSDLASHRDMLRKSLHEKNLLEESNHANKDFKATLDIIKAATVGRPEGEKTTLEAQIRTLLSSTTATKEELDRQNGIVAYQKARIAELQKFQEDTTSRPAVETEPSLSVPESPPNNPDLERKFANLERENKLMASAYYDLAGRLQMNNVALLRRTEAPRGAMGRWRAEVERDFVRSGVRK